MPVQRADLLSEFSGSAYPPLREGALPTARRRLASPTPTHRTREIGLSGSVTPTLHHSANSSAGRARDHSSPWARSHPDCTRKARCCSPLTPSATTRRPKACAILMMATTIGPPSGTNPIWSTNDLSILTTFSDRPDNDARDEYPRPKSSMATPTPRL